MTKEKKQNIKTYVKVEKRKIVIYKKMFTLLILITYPFISPFVYGVRKYLLVLNVILQLLWN